MSKTATKAASAKTTTLLEVAYSDKPTVDRDAGVIRGVRILGRKSKNGYEYSDVALAQAAKLYEGVGVNVDHPDRKTPTAERSVGEAFGWLESVKIAADGVYGDLHYLKEHPQAAVLCEAAERRPNRFGLSHNANGQVTGANGKRIVESVENVRSVDIVQVPATNTSLFESEAPAMKKSLLEAVIGIDKTAPERKALLHLLEEDAMQGVGEMAVEMPAEGSSDDQVKAAFRAMVVAAFDDESLDTKATLARIKDILSAYDKLMSGASSKPDAGGGAPPAGDSAPTMESLAAELRDLRADNECRLLLESAGVECTPVRLKSLKSLGAAADRKELVESWPKRSAGSSPFGAGSGRRPATSAPLLESTGGETLKFPDNAKSFAAMIR